MSLCAARPAMAPAGKSECRMVFDHIDEDESEALSLTEVSAALEKVGSDMGQAEVEELLETMDTDGSKYVEFDEFEEWWRDHEEDRGALFGRLLRRCKADAGAGALQGTDGAKTAPVLPYTKAAGKSDCRKVFERMDADGGGTLDIDEIRAMLQRVGSDLSLSDLATVVSSMDEDDSELIDYEEFEAWWKSHEEERLQLFGRLLDRIQEEVMNSSGKSECRVVFEYIDKDESDAVDLDEMLEIIEKIGTPMSPEEVEDLLQSMDEDDSRLVDYEEFEDWWYKHKNVRDSIFGQVRSQSRSSSSSCLLETTWSHCVVLTT